tara:strand:+ start:276 stop:755 length:480 start_codon:yes stop_codon:yes gene_type:complete
LLFVREVEQFLFHEVSLLDDRRFEDWTDLFTEDGYYWAPAEINQPDPASGVSLFFDDVPMMRIRFARLRHPRVHSQIPPSRTSHSISNVTAKRSGTGDRVEVEARFQMLDYRPGHDQRAFGGKYEYVLSRSDAGCFRIASKKAVIINCDDVHLPVAVPF